MTGHRIGSQAWYDVHPEAPSRAEAERDAAEDRGRRDEHTTGPLTDAVTRERWWDK